MKKTGHYLAFLVAIGLLACTILISQLFIFFISPNQELPHSENHAEYSFDQQTIQKFLAHGNFNIFTPVPETSPSPTPSFISTNGTRFDDFLVIAEAFHQWKWKESTDSWSLYWLEYKVECGNVESGPSFADIEFFYITSEEDVRYVHKIFISFSDGTIYSAESVRYPLTENWQVIDLRQIAIPANEVLQIAENNGGLRTRLSVNNNCTIFVHTPNVSKSSWTVTYAMDASEGWQYLLEVYVDKETGEFRIVHPE